MKNERKNNKHRRPSQRSFTEKNRIRKPRRRNIWHNREDGGRNTDNGQNKPRLHRQVRGGLKDTEWTPYPEIVAWCELPKLVPYEEEEQEDEDDANI